MYVNKNRKTQQLIIKYENFARENKCNNRVGFYK